MKKTDLEGELPKGFINVTLKKGKWQFSSMELVRNSLLSYHIISALGLI